MLRLVYAFAAVPEAWPCVMQTAARGKAPLTRPRHTRRGCVLRCNSLEWNAWAALAAERTRPGLTLLSSLPRRLPAWGHRRDGVELLSPLPSTVI